MLSFEEMIIRVTSYSIKMLSTLRPGH
jgi:hypothetical protein